MPATAAGGAGEVLRPSVQVRWHLQHRRCGGMARGEGRHIGSGGGRGCVGVKPHARFHRPFYITIARGLVAEAVPLRNSPQLRLKGGGMFSGS